MIPSEQRLVAVALISLSTAACNSTLDTYHCQSDAECKADDGSGVCESNELCSFANLNCPDQRAYGEAAGELSGTCVAASDAAPMETPDANAGALPPCADEDLGSALGAAVATGTTVGTGDNQSQCEMARWRDGEDYAYAWTAPAAGDYTFDLCGSDGDLVLSLLANTCTGSVLACNDDSDDTACGDLNSRFTKTLTAGQLVVVIVDSLDAGNDILNITQL